MAQRHLRTKLHETKNANYLKSNQLYVETEKSLKKL